MSLKKVFGKNLKTTMKEMTREKGKSFKIIEGILRF